MLANIKGAFTRFHASDDGLETVEYAIITGLVVAATLTAIAAIGTWVLAQFQALQTGVGG